MLKNNHNAMEKISLDNPQKPELPKTVSATKGGTTFADLDAKLDRIIKYQKTVRGIAIFRGIISFIFFLVFIVLPIVGGFYLFQYIRANIDFDKIGSQYTEFRETIDELKEKSDKVGNLDELLEKQPKLPQ
jgi:hypothetical protein